MQLNQSQPNPSPNQCTAWHEMYWNCLAECVLCPWSDKAVANWLWLQNWEKVRGLVKFVLAVAYHFCLNLPAIFSQPRTEKFSQHCIFSTPGLLCKKMYSASKHLHIWPTCTEGHGMVHEWNLNYTISNHESLSTSAWMGSNLSHMEMKLIEASYELKNPSFPPQF